MKDLKDKKTLEIKGTKNNFILKLNESENHTCYIDIYLVDAFDSRHHIGCYYLDLSLGVPHINHWLNSDINHPVEHNEDIPQIPERVYKNEGWTNWADWLGI